MDTKDILRKKRLELGLTYEELGKLVGVGKSTVRKWETGMIDNMRRDNIVALSKALNISPILLMGIDDGEEHEQQPPTNTTWLRSDQSDKLTVYGKVCAGNGIEAFEDPIDEIQDPYYRVKGEKFALLVDGDSMNNVVNHGMYAIIEKRSTVSNGEIAVVLIDHEVSMLKRFYRIDDMVILRPDSSNPDYKPLAFIGDEINSLKILGRYLGCVSPMENLL
ncbi:LexA family protein [Turicibacter sanguinis]|uniref:LexA family protein n=1 Tax=Turicibacter sanguinis TaxID=154288 RepID=UPI0018A0E0D4|nr:XRE family transcriptional regulator [Turicibacter sanguinis]